MTKENRAKSLKLAIVVLGVVLVAGLVSVGWWWKEKQAMDGLVSPGLRLINYTNHDVYASVHYSGSPDPEDGASDQLGPHAGGGSLVCCVSIPARWRPGIKMVVWYSSKDWKKENGQTKVIELPEYPDGRPGSLYLVFHSETELELMSTIFAPGHPRWPGRQVEPIVEGLK